MSDIVRLMKLYYCDKFIAERKTSLGKDWHSSCLRCKTCKKVLNPGGHSEV